MFEIPILEKTTVMLPEVVVGRASALEGVIIGIPPNRDNVQVSFGQSNGSTLACPCDAKKGGKWKFYAGGAYFLTVCETNYHVTAKSSRGDSVYLGSGRLRVVPSVLNVSNADVPLLPQDCYVRGANGLYYKVTAELDGDGVPYMVVERNGVVR